MLNAYAYERDKEVVDVEDPPALNRVPTEDLAVHVLVDGAYHRRHPALAKTSCGILYHSQFSPIRRELLVHPLSRTCGCFTADELAEADDAETESRRGTL